MKPLYFCLVAALHLLPPQLTLAAGSQILGNTYWHDLLESQPNSVTGSHRRTSRRTRQGQQQELPSQQGLTQPGLYPPEGYYHQSSEGFTEFQQDFSGQMSHFGSETAEDARRTAYEGERGVADDDLSSAHSMTQERRRRRAKAKEIQLRRQQMSEVGGGEEDFDEAASQLSLAHLSLHGHMGSGTDASAMHTQQFSSAAQSDFDFSGSSTSRASRRKSKAAVGTSEPQTARLASRRDHVHMAPAAAQAPSQDTIQEKINDPRFRQLFNRAWARHRLGYNLQPSEVAAKIIEIRHELRCPAAVEVLALGKIDAEAPMDQRDFRGVYRKWIVYYKQMEARGVPIAAPQQASRGMGGSSSQQLAGGSRGGNGGEDMEGHDDDDDDDSESTEMVPDYAPLSSSDRKNLKEAHAVFSVFMTNHIWSEAPRMDPNDVPIETIENLSWGLKVGDFDKDKAESLLRFYLERVLGKSKDELAQFDSLRYATRKAWKAQVRAMKEERIAKALQRSRRS